MSLNAFNFFKILYYRFLISAFNSFMNINFKVVFFIILFITSALILNIS
jgi:hypothetical protein